MPNPIKYNTSVESRALEKGNFWIGTGDVDKGPSTTTGFYNGITPATSGYTIYIYNPSQTSNLSYHSCPNDTELIRITNQFATASFTLASQCFLWYATQSNYMVVNRDYETITTDGLVLNMDAGFIPSYPTTGNTCYDLTSYGNNGTLINGATYTNSVGGIFRLDGTNDRIDVPRTLNGFTRNIHWDINWTIECWMYLNQPDASPQNYKMIYGNYSGCNFDVYPGNGTGFLIYNATNSSTVYTSFGFGPKSPSGCPDEISWNTSESSWVYESGISKWCHFIMTSDDGTNYRIYVNGTQRGATKTFDFKNSSGRSANNLTASNNYSWGGDFTGNSANQVDFSSMRIYNRPLSATEILQNYQNTFTRFLGENIVTSGLIFYVDAGYSSSFTTASNTWLDISGLGNNGTLTNGPTYSSVGGGSIIFDGTNDFVISSTNTGISGNNPRTMQVWINMNGATYSSYAYYSMGKIGPRDGFGAANGNVFEILVRYETDQDKFSLWGHFYGIPNPVYYFDSLVPLNTWAMVTLVHTGTTASVTLNGNTPTANANNVVARTLNTTNTAVEIGRPSFTSGHSFGKGLISQFRVYNRALTQDEINQNFNAQKARYGL